MTDLVLAELRAIREQQERTNRLLAELVDLVRPERRRRETGNIPIYRVGHERPVAWFKGRLADDAGPSS